MIIIGENLEKLIRQHNMVSKDCFDETCISLSLGKTCIELVPSEELPTLTYGEPIPQKYISQFEINENGLVLLPKSAVLAVSAEEIYMPQGYMGLLQTKGSLARMLVSLHFSDGQVDSGFRGHITFEIFNASDFKICIRKLNKVGNLYVFKASTKKHKLYSGRYSHSTVPTLQVPYV